MSKLEDIGLKIKMKPIHEMINYFANMDAVGLKEVSNDAIEQAVMNQDPIYVDISLISYALSKLVGKPHFFKSVQWKTFQQDFVKHLSSITEENLGSILKIIIEDITKIDQEMGNYVEDVIEKARIKQASRAYALGLSLGQSAELTGVDKAYLLSYIGFTKIHDRPFTQSRSVIERYRYLKELLG